MKLFLKNILESKLQASLLVRLLVRVLMCNTSNKTTEDIIIYNLQTFDIELLLFVSLIKPTFSYDLFPKQKEEKLQEKNNQGYNHDSTMKVISSFIFI